MIMMTTMTMTSSTPSTLKEQGKDDEVGVRGVGCSMKTQRPTMMVLVTGALMMTTTTMMTMMMWDANDDEDNDNDDGDDNDDVR